MGRTLDVRVVAEGIEEPDQAAWLISLGCVYGQGYLYSRPLRPDAIEAFLAGDASRRAQLGTGYQPRVDDLAEDDPFPRRRRQPRRLRLVSGD